MRRRDWKIEAEGYEKADAYKCVGFLTVGGNLDRVMTLQIKMNLFREIISEYIAKNVDILYIMVYLKNQSRNREKQIDQSEKSRYNI